MCYAGILFPMPVDFFINFCYLYFSLTTFELWLFVKLLRRI